MVELATSFNDETFALMSRFAKEEKINLADVMRDKMIEWLEDLKDLRDAKAILADNDDEIISHEEFWRDL
ncbi:MAG: hypothetical protein IKP64_06715 [Selenomonadaceae bacterium]|nr:hypothetical protein [Selenomonadaceae bacterium]